MTGRYRLGASSRALTLLLIATALRPTSAQAVDARWRSLVLHPVPTLKTDTASYFARASLRISPARPLAAALRITIDNPCGVTVRMRAREHPGHTLELQARTSDGLICPGLLNLETYTVLLSPMRAGHWRVVAKRLPSSPVDHFTIE
jgi:hypothetical protein